MRTLAFAALVSLSFGSLACASPQQPASMKPVAKAEDGYSREVRAVMEDHVALATGAPPAALAAEGFAAPASDLVSVPPTPAQKKAACAPRSAPPTGKLVEGEAKRACAK